MKKQKNNIRMKIRSSSIFLKITVLFEAVLILSLVFVVLFVTLQFSKTLKDKEIALGDTKIEKLSNYMLERYNRIYSLSNYMNRGEISPPSKRYFNCILEGYRENGLNTDYLIKALEHSLYLQRQSEQEEIEEDENLEEGFQMTME